MSLLGSALAGIVVAGPGQFGFVHSHKLAFCDVTPNSFTVAGTQFTTGPERTGFVVTNLSRHQKTLTMRPSPHSPTRIVFESAAEGFSMEYRGDALITAGIEAPFVSWAEGSVGPGVPSAPSKWVLLSWPTPRPPILLWFGGAEASVTVDESSRGFSLQIPKFSGIVRVRFPYGTTTKAAKNVAQLGALVEQMTPEIQRLSRAPNITNFSLVDTERGLLATWTFDKPGAMLPGPLIAGLRAGCAKMLSPKKQVLSGAFVSETKEISVLFLVKRLEPGLRFVRNASSTGTVVDGGSYANVARASVDYLCGNWSGAAELALLNARANFISDLQFSKDPLSENLVPFAPGGGGSAMASAFAIAAGVLDEPATWLNGLLSSVDWVTWLPMGATPDERRDAAAMLTVACAFRGEPDARLIGAMANCGALAAADSPFIELRSYIYPTKNGAAYNWVRALESPIRILSRAMTLIDVPNVGFSVSGVVDSLRGFDVVIESDQPLKVAEATGIEQALMIGNAKPTIVRVKPLAVGPWSLRLARALPGAPIPKGAPSPRYSAAPR